jgi:hypothetical protein
VVNCGSVVDRPTAPFTGPRETTLISKTARPAAPYATHCSRKPLRGGEYRKRQVFVRHDWK